MGHTKQKDFFINAIKSHQLSHAYLLTGADGIGKKHFAKQLAKGLLCHPEISKMEKNPNYVPDLHGFFDLDNITTAHIDNETHPDFYLFEVKDDIKDEFHLNVKAVRRVGEIAEMTAYAGGWKVIIFDDIHIINQGVAEGANALLKTLEEPGSNTLFLLITHKPERILPTIRSRAINITFNPLKDDELLQILREINPNILWEIIIPHAGGSIAKAQILSLLPVKELVEALNKKNKTEIGKIILNLDSKPKISNIIDIINTFLLNNYKINAKSGYMKQIQDNAIFVKNLDYNVNTSIQLLSYYTNLIYNLEL